MAYTVGVGEDISFDLALAETFGCKVFAFDPTPVAIDFIKKQTLPARISFIPTGLSSKDGWENFYTPQIPGYHSFSQTIDPGQGPSAPISCEVLTLKSIMRRYHHRRIDLLKMDIEGFEYDVIEEIISSGTLPSCLMIEFHHLVYGIGIERTYAAVENLRANGYRIFWMSPLGREYGFLLCK